MPDPDWRARAGDRLVSAETAVARVRSGDLVRLALGPGPPALLAALACRREELRQVRVHQSATAFPHPWATDLADWEGHVTYVTDYITPLVRPCLDARRGDFAVTDYAIGSTVQAPGRHDGWAADVFMAVVSEPDADGRVHFAWGPWHAPGLMRAARLRIAEVSPGLIRPRGTSSSPLTDFDLVVAASEPPLTLPAYPAPTGERRIVVDAIGAQVARLVHDGDTLQLGSGTVSAVMASYLTDRNELGVDSEILVPSLIDLVKHGVASGRRKVQHAGVATGACIVPGADMSFCDDNPRVALYDIEWVNNLPRIAGIPHLIAINQALAIDLTGQVTAESLGPVMFTGPGGQLVWTMGALFAPGGRSVHVLPATARDGTVSRIVPQLPVGTVVTVPRTFVDFVVTEHGTANLQGLTQRERALALIELAAPAFRAELRHEARRLFWP